MNIKALSWKIRKSIKERALPRMWQRDGDIWAIRSLDMQISWGKLWRMSQKGQLFIELRKMPTKARNRRRKPFLAEYWILGNKPPGSVKLAGGAIYGVAKL
ncbi:MAG TPA: hypothetical protein VJB12_04615 [Candidatus Nanoarchaeia archaeon]|nr:hypothetical protein [Candidatus Nanoarchaeia archaeon]